MRRTSWWTWEGKAGEGNGRNEQDKPAEGRRSFMEVGHRPQALWLAVAPFSISNLSEVVTHGTCRGWGGRVGTRLHVETTSSALIILMWRPFHHRLSPGSLCPSLTVPSHSQSSTRRLAPPVHSPPQGLLGSLPAPGQATTFLRTKDTKTLGDFWQQRLGRPENGREAGWEPGRAGAGVGIGSPRWHSKFGVGMG